MIVYDNKLVGRKSIANANSHGAYNVEVMVGVIYAIQSFLSRLTCGSLKSPNYLIYKCVSVVSVAWINTF